MTSPTPEPAARPLSPHLQIYKPQLTSVLSILHRMTGIGLSLALPALVAWLVALSMGGEVYEIFIACAASPVGKLLLMGWSWAFCYHLCTGIRHLIWDTGRGLELKQVYRGGYIALGVSTLLTAVLWLSILYGRPPW